jgi:hypothetical protein
MIRDTLGAQLRAIFRVDTPLDSAMQASLSSLASDPVLASAIRCIGDGGDTDDPRVEALAERVAATRRG